MTKKFHITMLCTFSLALVTIGYSWPLGLAITIYLIGAIAGWNHFNVPSKRLITKFGGLKSTSKQATAKREYWLRALDEDDESDDCETNPATGLYMMGMYDTGGNAYGFSDASDKFWDDSSHSDWQVDSPSFFDD